jgi:hypothetical protein
MLRQDKTYWVLFTLLLIFCSIFLTMIYGMLST